MTTKLYSWAVFRNKHQVLKSLILELLFLQENGGKRKKSSSDTVGTPEKVARVDIRRSTRHRRLRGEKPITVDASHTLKDLKVQVRIIFPCLCSVGEEEGLF